MGSFAYTWYSAMMAVKRPPNRNAHKYQSPWSWKCWSDNPALCASRRKNSTDIHTPSRMKAKRVQMRKGPSWKASNTVSRLTHGSGCCRVTRRQESEEWQERQEGL